MKYSVLENIKLKTSKGSLELLPGQVATLPNKIASRLLGEGRITSHETVPEPISNEALQDLFLETMDRINDEYLAGTIKYIQEHHKDIDDEIDKADNRINDVWQKCNNCEAVIEDFKGALDLYANLYLKAIGVYKETILTK